MIFHDISRFPTFFFESSLGSCYKNLHIFPDLLQGDAEKVSDSHTLQSEKANRRREAGRGTHGCFAFENML